MEKTNDKTLFGIMTIIFNSVGVPSFMRGDSKTGVKHILISVFTCGIGALILEIKGIIEGIRVLKLSDEEYMAEKYPENAPAAEAPAAEADSFVEKAFDTVKEAATEVVDDAADAVLQAKDVAETVVDKVVEGVKEATDKE